MSQQTAAPPASNKDGSAQAPVADPLRLAWTGVTPPAGTFRDDGKVLKGALLVGGGASAGKTTAALSIARVLGVEPVVHIDDVRRVHPQAIHRLDSAGVWDTAPNDLLRLLLVETASLHGVLAHLVAGMLSVSRGVIIEGEGVEPELIDRLGADARVRCAYVIETNPIVLRRTFAARPSADRFLALSRRQQQAVVEMNRLYATWLRDEAVPRGQAWVQSRPWATLPERILRAAATEITRRPGLPGEPEHSWSPPPIRTSDQC